MQFAMCLAYRVLKNNARPVLLHQLVQKKVREVEGPKVVDAHCDLRINSQSTGNQAMPSTYNLAFGVELVYRLYQAAVWGLSHAWTKLSISNINIKCVF